jgi:hypothetical protein
LGAVQSQDYAGAKWALGLRARPGVTDSVLQRLFDEGAILRTHVMRPTWHFVLPEDIRWLGELTGPRVRAGLRGRHRELEIDERVIAGAKSAFTKALAGGKHLTRPELGQALESAGIAPEGQRLPHLLMLAELGALIASGPRRGKQFTYALLEERAPNARRLDREAALGELACRYFRSHGPAQLQDFVWWSGLTAADARTAVRLAGTALGHEQLDGKDYWFDPMPGPAVDPAVSAHLLPNFDEYTVAYRDRTAAVPAARPFDPSMFAFGSILANVVIVGGLVRGAWRRTLVRGRVRIEIRLLDRLDRLELDAVEEAARRLERFLERPLELAWI